MDGRVGKSGLIMHGRVWEDTRRHKYLNYAQDWKPDTIYMGDGGTQDSGTPDTVCMGEWGIQEETQVS